MIAFIDIQNKNVKLYTEKGLINIPFQEVNTLKQLVKNNKILYITNAIYTSADEIINIINGNSKQNNKTKTIKKDNSVNKKDKRLFLYPKKGSVALSDINFIFRSKYDLKLLDKEMKLNIKHSKELQNMLKRGIIEVVDANKRKEILKEKEIKDRKKDKAYDSIILDENVEDWKQKQGNILFKDDTPRDEDGIAIEMEEGENKASPDKADDLINKLKQKG